MKYLLLLLLMLLAAPVLAQPVPLTPYEAAMQAGNAADAQGQLMQALAAYRRAVKAAETAPDHPEWLIRSLLKFGELTERAGDDGRGQQAVAIFTRALAVAEKTYGTDDARLVEPLTKLGWQLWRQKNYPLAEARLTRALAISEKAFPADSTQVADARFSLGGFYMEQNSREKAIAYYRQALATYEKAYGPEHQRTLFTHLNLGDCLLRNKQYREAEIQYQLVLDVGDRSWEYGSARIKLSAVYTEQKQYDKAEPLELQVFTSAEKHYGTDSPGLVYNLNRLAKFYRDAGKPEQAEPYLRRVIPLMTNPETWEPYLAKAHENYAELLAELKRPAEAKKEYTAANDIYQRWLARYTRKHQDTGEMFIPRFYHDQVPDYLQFLSRYAAFQRKQGDQDEAARLDHRAAEVEDLLTRSKAVYGGRKP